ncbi:Retinol dehydrogenase 13 [Enhygromyxa salina]|uniref:Retinol dehydrogenase 13 n=1 Tax=Enhygromyxa salina TaxID=215803 RepID=A0A0C2D7P0_9BACT|nr:SDR family oxidoreductase [Enhygromyxa salina]KIG17630.1 Retinol dehydrogenase 13 [Enhygromyxa salina]
MADVDMSGKTVLITGGNSGIGRYTAIGLARMGAKVVFTSRNLRKGDVARAELREIVNKQQVDCMELNLSSFRSIEQFAKQFLAKYPRLDVLVLNAGSVLDTRRVTDEGFEMTFGVNHLGHFFLTQLLRAHLEAASARVVVVASDAHRGARSGLNFDDLMFERAYKGWAAYSASKLANILFANELGRRFEGVTANSLHPGVVRTGFARDGDVSNVFARAAISIARPFLIGPERGAQTSIYLASAPELEGKTGGYYDKCRPGKQIAAAQDDEAAKRLWEVSEALVEQGLAKRKPKS